jgi:hypothetical protein
VRFGQGANTVASRLDRHGSKELSLTFLPSTLGRRVRDIANEDFPRSSFMNLIGSRVTLILNVCALVVASIVWAEDIYIKVVGYAGLTDPIPALFCYLLLIFPRHRHVDY